MKKRSKERFEAFQALKNKGNYVHNMRVKTGSKEGEIVPWRRAMGETSSGKKNMDDFLVCEDCQAFFFRKTLWHHKRSCKKRGNRIGRGRVQVRARNLLPPSQGISEGLKLVLDSMVVDEVSLICKTDPMILKYGEKLHLKLGHEAHQRHYISTKMRELARLLKNLRERSSGSTLSDYLSPDKFEHITASVRSLASYQSIDNRYGVPSLALKVGQSLVKCALIKKAEQIQQGQDTTAVSRFLELYDMEWTDQVARGALSTLREKRWNNPPLIPLTRDIQILQKYLDSEMHARKELLLRDGASPTAHKAFAEVVLTRLMLFNRRRQGEAGRLRVADFAMRRPSNADDVVIDSLSPLEKELAASLTRVVVKGKKGRGVPILLTDDLQSAVQLLITKRASVGIDDSNPYIFVNTLSADHNPLRGSDCLRKCVTECGASAPDAITSTGLRRHIATLSQVLALRDNELDMLANFLGHDIRVHREFYRLPEATMQVAKISKLLMCMEQGVKNWKGKNLDELDMVADGDSVCEAEQVDDGTAEISDDGGATDVRADGGNHSSPVPSDFRPAPPRPGRRTTRRVWTAAEIAAIRRQLSPFLEHLEVPGKVACERAIAAESALSSRSWKSVKYYVYNTVRAAVR